jgi:hypothetical protein
VQRHCLILGLAPSEKPAGQYFRKSPTLIFSLGAALGIAMRIESLVREGDDTEEVKASTVSVSTVSYVRNRVGFQKSIKALSRTSGKLFFL